MRDCRGGFSDVHSLGSGLLGFRPGIGSRIARLGFEFAVAVVPLLGIEVSALIRSAWDSVVRCWFQPVGFRVCFRSVALRVLSVSQISSPRVRAVGKDDESMN
jgi:hypothetical protein